MTFEYLLPIENNQRTKPSWQHMNKQTIQYVCYIPTVFFPPVFEQS
jgi:hypothetical protein